MVASCRNRNRTFHTIEAIGVEKCDDNRTVVPVQKFCPSSRLYHPEVRFCGPTGADGVEYQQRMMWRLRDGFRTSIIGLRATKVRPVARAGQRVRRRGVRADGKSGPVGRRATASTWRNTRSWWSGCCKDGRMVVAE